MLAQFVPSDRASAHMQLPKHAQLAASARLNPSGSIQMSRRLIGVNESPRGVAKHVGRDQQPRPGKEDDIAVRHSHPALSHSPGVIAWHDDMW